MMYRIEHFNNIMHICSFRDEQDYLNEMQPNTGSCTCSCNTSSIPWNLRLIEIIQMRNIIHMMHNLQTCIFKVPGATLTLLEAVSVAGHSEQLLPTTSFLLKLHQRSCPVAVNFQHCYKNSCPSTPSHVRHKSLRTPGFRISKRSKAYLTP
jgi:hypothetical protein